MGRVTSKTDQNGYTTSYIYDGIGQLIQVSDAQLGTDQGHTVYSYDQVGNKVYQRNAEYHDTQWTFDALGRQLTRNMPNHYEEVFEYDAVGNRTSLTVTPEGGVATTTNYSYDTLNRLHTVTDPDNQVTTYSYDNVGNRASISYPNGNVTSYTYDSLNRLVRQTTVDSTSSVLTDYQYALDNSGHRSQIIEANGRITDYSYDRLDRLVSEIITDPVNGNYSAEYTYNKISDRTSSTVNGVTTSFSGTSMGNTYYGYDTRGNIIYEQPRFSPITRYTYNIKDELIGITRDGLVTSYAYDIDGIRIQKTEDSLVTDYLVDHNRDYAQVIRETRATDSIAYLYGDDLISQERNGLDSYYLYDGLGSTRALSDASGIVTDRYDYEAYGDVLNQTGSTENDYLFTGEQYDATLDHYYLRARYMYPALGRFTQMDTWMGIEDEPLTLNKYLYANANPSYYTDPTGKFSMVQAMAATSVVGTLSSLATSKYSPFNDGSGSTIAQTASNLDLGERPDIGEVIEMCFAEHYDFDDAMIRLLIGTGAIPIYKPSVKMRVIGNASRYTNFISAVGHWKFRGVNLPFRLLGTNRAAGVAGRANIAVAAGFAAYDITSISLCISYHL